MLFGASTPFAKALVGQVSPLLLAGLPYAGSGTGPALWLSLRLRKARTAGKAALTRRDLPWRAGAILFGGILGPALLMPAMAVGVWLHVSERHDHEHTHEAMDHTHSHRHDEHHRHDVPRDGSDPHTHPHHRPALTHAHPRYPDQHHRHEHR